MLVKSSTYVKVKDLALTQKMKYYKVNKKDCLGGGQERGVKNDKKCKRELDKIVVRGILFRLRTDDRNVIFKSVVFLLCFSAFSIGIL